MNLLNLFCTCILDFFPTAALAKPHGKVRESLYLQSWVLGTLPSHYTRNVTKWHNSVAVSRFQSSGCHIVETIQWRQVRNVMSEPRVKKMTIHAAPRTVDSGAMLNAGRTSHVVKNFSKQISCVILKQALRPFYWYDKVT